MTPLPCFPEARKHPQSSTSTFSSRNTKTQIALIDLQVVLRALRIHGGATGAAMTAEGLFQRSLTIGEVSDRPHTPSLTTPPRSKTPPTVTTRRTRQSLGNGEGPSGLRADLEAIEADALSRRLRESENGGRQRETTPGRSPSRKRQRVYGDR